MNKMPMTRTAGMLTTKIQTTPLKRKVNQDLGSQVGKGAENESAGLVHRLHHRLLLRPFLLRPFLLLQMAMHHQMKLRQIPLQPLPRATPQKLNQSREQANWMRVQAQLRAVDSLVVGRHH